MRIIKFAAFLFYRYYSTGHTSDIKYFSTLCALTLLSFIHVFQLLILFDIIWIIPQGHKNKISTRLEMVLFLLPIFLIFRLLIREPELKQMNYAPRVIKRGYLWLIVYAVISFALFGILAFFKKDM